MYSNFVLICSQVCILCCLFLKIPNITQKNPHLKAFKYLKENSILQHFTIPQQPGVGNPCTRSITSFLWSYGLCRSLWEYHKFLTSTSLFVWIDPHSARMTQFTCSMKLQNKIFSLKRCKTNEKEKEAGRRLCLSYLLLKVGKYPCVVAQGNFSTEGIEPQLGGSTSAIHSMHFSFAVCWSIFLCQCLDEAVFP